MTTSNTINKSFKEIVKEVLTQLYVDTTGEAPRVVELALGNAPSSIKAINTILAAHQLAIDKAVGEARINELEIMPSSTFNHPYREYIKQRLAALQSAKQEPNQ